MLFKQEMEKNNIIYEIRQKFKEIINNYNKIKQRNLELEEENKNLKTTINLLNKKIQEFEDKELKKNLAKTILATSKDSHDVKIKLNKIVRDIDRCIALLEKE